MTVQVVFDFRMILRARAICAAKGVRYVVIDMKGIEEVGSPGPVRRAQIKLPIHERFGRLEKLTEEDHQLHGCETTAIFSGASSAVR